MSKSKKSKSVSGKSRASTKGKPKKKHFGFLTPERAAARMATLQNAGENADLHALSEALLLLMTGHTPAPVWLCGVLLRIIDQLRGQQQTGRRGPRATEASRIARNRIELSRYFAVQREIDQAVHDGRRLPMKIAYRRAQLALQMARGVRSERAIQNSYLGIRRRIQREIFRPEDYFADDPEIAIDLIGQSMQE